MAGIVSKISVLAPAYSLSPLGAQNRDIGAACDAGYGTPKLFLESVVTWDSPVSYWWTFPEAFVKVNSTQFSCGFESGEWYGNYHYS